MRMLPPLVLAVLGSWSRLAHARPDLELGFHGGVAREIDPTVRGDLGPYGAGFGARAGASLGRLHVGAWYVAHLGTTARARGAGSSYYASSAAWLLGAELGWDIRASDRFVLRPLLGAGLRRLYGYTTVNGSRLNDASFNPYAVVGVLAAARFDAYFVGPELRLLMTPLDLPQGWSPMLALVAGATL
jgi:hypothetical protein